jgi:hypothetical protein
MANSSVLTLLLTVVVLISPTLKASSADIENSGKKLCAFDLSGPIMTGDFNKLSAIVSTAKITPNDERTSAICLKSNGGSYAEGLKIAELIYLRGLSTVIEYGSECYSSCAIIFMAGVTTERELPMRKLSVGGVLGFHAPFLTVPDEKYSKEDIEGVVRDMRMAILALVRLSSKHTQLHGSDFIKKSLISKILEKGPKEAFFVRTIYDAARWDILIHDASERMSKSNNIDGLKNACRNFHSSNMDEEAPFQSELSLKVEKYSSKFQKDDARILVQNSKTMDTICEIYPRTFGQNDSVKFFACSQDYWSSRSFGNCREYRTAPAVLVGKFVPDFFTYAPSEALLRFKK